MKQISPVGIMIVLFGALIGIVLWVVGYFELPNQDTHRDLARNPQVQSSVNPNATTGGGSSGGTTTASGGGTAAATDWYSLDKAPKTLDLTITSAATTDMSGMNFNGYGSGALKMMVPQGWKVNVTFANKDATIVHSVGFTTWTERTNGTGQFPAAFPGSLGPKFNTGMVATDGNGKFSFTASKSGQYAMVCGIPGHAAAGMWDEFDVSASAKAPTITTPSGTVTVK